MFSEVYALKHIRSHQENSLIINHSKKNIYVYINQRKKCVIIT